MRKLVSAAVLTGFLNGSASAAEFDLVAVADAEGDGVVSKDEFTAYYALTWLIYTGGKSEVDVDRTHPVVRAMILGALPEAEGTVGRDELLDAVPALYSNADTDEDGIVTLAEMKVWAATAMTAPAS